MATNSSPRLLATAATVSLFALLAAACAGTPAPGTETTPAPVPDSAPTGTPADLVPTPDSGVATRAPNGQAGSGAGSATVEIAGQVYLLAATVCSLDSPGPVLDLASPTGLASLNATTGISGVTTLTLETAADGGTWFVGGQELFVVDGSTATFSGTLSDPASGREEQATITVICGDIS